MIDMPLVLKKSKSLFSDTFRYPGLRLMNLLMRHGQRRLVTTRWTAAESNFLNPWRESLSHAFSTEHWFGLLYTNRTYGTAFTNHICDLELQTAPECNLGRAIFKGRYFFSADFSLADFLLRRLVGQNPLFMFFIKKNDKMRRKHGRGKVEKLKVM